MQAFMWSRNKILVLLGCNNYLWIKSKNTYLNNYISYDAQVNKSSNLFWNKLLLEKILPMLSNHPRIDYGYISSTNEKNLHKAIGSLETQYKQCINKKKSTYRINQKSHFKMENEIDYLRDFSRMKYTIQPYTESNTIIIESDRTKCQRTLANSVFQDHFNENYFDLKSNEKKEKLKMEMSFLESIIEIIEKNDGDIRIRFE